MTYNVFAWWDVKPYSTSTSASMPFAGLQFCVRCLKTWRKTQKPCSSTAFLYVQFLALFAYCWITRFLFISSASYLLPLVLAIRPSTNNLQPTICNMPDNADSRLALLKKIPWYYHGVPRYTTVVQYHGMRLFYHVPWYTMVGSMVYHGKIQCTVILPRYRLFIPWYCRDLPQCRNIPWYNVNLPWQKAWHTIAKHKLSWYYHGIHTIILWYHSVH